MEKEYVPFVEIVNSEDVVNPLKKNPWCICGCTCGSDINQNLTKAEGASEWVFAD